MISLGRIGDLDHPIRECDLAGDGQYDLQNRYSSAWTGGGLTA